MSPTNLGALPSELPFPNQRVQIKRGVTPADVTVTNLTAYGSKLSDGAGGVMEISYQPRYDCYWLVRTNSIWRGRADSDATWRRVDQGIFITPADASGVTEGVRRPMALYPSGTVQWRTHSVSYMFKLAAGITYIAYMGFISSSGYWQEYHTNTQWHRIFGVVIGEGEV